MTFATPGSSLEPVGAAGGHRMPPLALGREPLRGLAALCSLLCLAFCAVAFAPVADANIPAPASLSLPVRAASLGGSSVGTLTGNVTFTDTRATATASAPGISLGPGNTFRVDVCIKAHSLKKSFDTKCDTKTVDTHSNTVPAAFAAPTVQASMDRPGTGGSAYFSFILSVATKQSDGSFKEGATSWPTGGTVAQSAIGVPLLGAAAAVAPKVEGVPMSTGATGGINTGNPDSFCMSRQNADPPPPGDGVSTSGLPSNAPAYYEVGEPSGDYKGQAPKGVMILLHGGGWYLNGPGAAATERGNADRWRAKGWRTLNISYRPCGASFADVQWFYDQARAQWGTAMPYCAMGSSAGGHLALMLAASRSTLDCVEDDAGPTDGTSVKDQKT